MQRSVECNCDAVCSVCFGGAGGLGRDSAQVLSGRAGLAAGRLVTVPLKRDEIHSHLQQRLQSAGRIMNLAPEHRDRRDLPSRR